jgi:putative thioredoxin
MTGSTDAFGQGAAGSPDPVTPAHPAAASRATSLIVDATDATFSDYIELSKTVPVIVDLWSTRSEPAQQLTPILERVVTEYAGRMVLVKVEVDANPQLAQAFQVQSIPTIVALIGGKTAPLFQGALPEVQVREVLTQVLDVAAENGVTGTLDASVESAGPAEPPLSPEHQEAFDAIERGDYAAATAAYEKALANDPKDALAEAGLAAGNTTEFTTRINALRAVDGLPAWAGSPSAQAMLSHSRAVSLFLQAPSIAGRV